MDVQDATLQEDPSVFMVFVDQGGGLYLGDAPVTEEQMLMEARARLDANPDMKAVLYVSSSQIQGIHLTAMLSEVGFKNVAVYYPTASPPK